MFEFFNKKICLNGRVARTIDDDFLILLEHYETIELINQFRITIKGISYLKNIKKLYLRNCFNVNKDDIIGIDVIYIIDKNEYEMYKKYKSTLKSQ